MPVRDMGRVGKELGRLETVLEKQAEVEEKTAEIQDLEEVHRLVRPPHPCLFPFFCLFASLSLFPFVVTKSV